MSEKVQDIRRQIDQLDNKIHDSLMKRAELVLKIGDEKRKNNLQIIQPDREVVMLRRLLARHKGPLPAQAVVRIWRELVGAVSLLQTGLRVAVCVPDGATGLMYWDMAKDYFSSVLPMQKVTNPLAAMSMVREGEATFAVLPWPEDDIENPWWSYMMDDQSDTKMQIFARLPLGAQNDEEASGAPFRALVIARLTYETSGEDRSFLMLELPKDISRAKLIEKAEALALKPLSLHTCTNHNRDRKVHLIELEGFYNAQSDIVQKMQEAFDDVSVRCVALGGYPVPPVYVQESQTPDSSS